MGGWVGLVWLHAVAGWLGGVSGGRASCADDASVLGGAIASMDALDARGPGTRKGLPQRLA